VAHRNNLSAAQVELNTIASSFACLSSITSQLHHYTLQRLAAASSSSDAAAALQLLSASRLPSNTAMQGICRALAAAVVAAGGQDAVMVMVVQPGERNAYDQQVGRFGVQGLESMVSYLFFDVLTCWQ
jgi:glutathione synthase